MMKKGSIFILMLLAMLCLVACGNREEQETADVQVTEEVQVTETVAETPTEQTPQDEATETADESQDNQTENHDMKMNVQVGNQTFTATLEQNDAVLALVEMMQKGPVEINMSDHGGFEKVGPLGTSLPTSNAQTTTTAGDIVLYAGNQIVVFYGSNSWSYTRLGKIDDLTGWSEALGNGSVTVTFSLA